MNSDHELEDRFAHSREVELLRRLLGIDQGFRIAGGWIRDQILGYPSHDIDVVIESLSGEEFARALEEKLGDLHVVHNPAQSSHLGSVKFTLGGYELDCTQLREEFYDDPRSRIPTRVHPAGLYKDALRRDFTINALYYHIEKCIIEDPTELGLSDIQHGIIRTPIPALVSFAQDPLRILRAIRFASRYDFELHEEIQECIKDSLLKGVVSRERIGEELWSMMLCTRPTCVAASISMLLHFRLFDHVFQLPDSDVLGWHEEGLHVFYSLVGALHQGNHEYVYFAAILWPVHGLEHIMYLNKLIPVSKYVLMDSLRLHKSWVDQIVLLLDALESVLKILPKDIDQDRTCFHVNRVQVGFALLDVHIDHLWYVCSLFGAVRGDVVLGRDLYGWVKDCGLIEVKQWKPYFNGNEIKSMFQVKGKVVGDLLKAQIEWKILHPREDSVDACKQYLKECLI